MLETIYQLSGILLICFSVPFFLVAYFDYRRTGESDTRKFYVPGGILFIGFFLWVASSFTRDMDKDNTIKEWARHVISGECQPQSPVYDIDNKLKEIRIQCKNGSVSFQGEDAQRLQLILESRKEKS